jgi:hypothetical protein
VLQETYDSGKFPGRTVEAINKQMQHCSIVATKQETIVETIKPAKNAMHMERAVKLFTTAFEQICKTSEVDKLAATGRSC